MAIELFLKFRDQTGAARRVKIDASPFLIGRAPDNNLSVSISALSRKHTKIERFADIFIVSDLNSNNGTFLNNREIKEPTALKNGDFLNLGNAVEIEIESEGEEPNAQPPAAAPGEEDSAAEPASNANFSPSGQNYGNAESTPFWQSIFFIAPVLGVLILVLTVVAIVALRNTDNNNQIARETNRRPENKRPPVNDNAENDPENQNENSNENSNAKPQASPTTMPANSTGNSNAASENSNNASVNSTAPPPTGEEDRVEKFALAFLRSASGDQNAFLGGKQVALVNQKIKALKNSAGFQNNVRAAQRSSAALEKLAHDNGLQPAFLTAAAVARLGDASGDPATTAAAMVGELKEYVNVIGMEVANEAPLIIAAYGEGSSPEGVRNSLGNLVASTGAAPVTVRTIWFLRDNKKLGDKGFNFALNFLAAGTVLQDPKSFL